MLPRIGAPKKASELALLQLGRSGEEVATSNRSLKGGEAAAATSANVFYPADLSKYSGTGQVLKTTTTHDIYVDGTETNGSNPGVFLLHWRQSQLVHVLDQYVGSTANNRYIGGTPAGLEYPIYTTLGDNDLVQMVHTSAAAFGAGYGHIYNIFLPQGVDFCEGSSCYSPDNPATFAFCAFHGSIDFTDLGHVLFTLEPYMDVPGCQVPQPSPNGSLVDSTANVLSHETSETITDPDGDAWLALSSLTEYGYEIGDVCETPTFQSPVTNLNGVSYEVQFEYSNKYHACSNVP
jgi:hypothetical protein